MGTSPSLADHAVYHDLAGLLAAEMRVARLLHVGPKRVYHQGPTPMKRAKWVVVGGLATALSLVGVRSAPGQAVATNFPPAPPTPDPFELVTSQPESAQTADARYNAIALLRRAEQNREFFAPAFDMISQPPFTREQAAPPYDAKISFTALGQAQQVGPGEMEETRDAFGDRRWTGSFGSFSLTRIISAADDHFYDLGSPGPIPIRLHMVRELLLASLPDLADFTPASIRTAKATLDGTSLICVLTSVTPALPPARDWSEREYCIDPQFELLRVYSAAPGIYVIFRYGDSNAFHGHMVADQFTIAEAGVAVLQGTISVTDPDTDSLDPARFTPTEQMRTDGVNLFGPISALYPVLSRGSNTSEPPVVVHATLGANGEVVEAEALQTSNSALSQSALELVKKSKYKVPRNWFGINPPQGEMYVLVR